MKSVKESPTRIDYEIEDMSGPPIEVKQFVDNDVSTYKIIICSRVVIVCPDCQYATAL